MAQAHAADQQDDNGEFGADFYAGRYDMGFDADSLARVFGIVDGELPPPDLREYDAESDSDSDDEEEFADCPKLPKGKSTRLCRTTLAQCILRFILILQCL